MEEVSKKLNIKFSPSGLILIQPFPMLGASPDAKGEDFVVEVKCSSKDKTVKNYLSQGKITPKCFAQVHLQMYAAGCKKSLFCVADPKFEENKQFNHI